MALKVEQINRRTIAADSIDSFIKALSISLAVHLIAIISIWVVPSILPDKKPELKEPDSYVVHLTDPGPVAEATKPLAKRKTRRKAQKFTVPSKSTALAKKIAPVTKMKTKNSEPAELKSVSKVEKVVKKTADLVKQKKTGGVIDIKKFPYEWYLRIMESKIYNNWDTLSLNFSPSNTLMVRTYFQINREGKMKNLKIDHSSQSDEVDNSALEAIRLSTPFPPLPPGYEENVLEVYFGFRVETTP